MSVEADVGKKETVSLVVRGLERLRWLFAILLIAGGSLYAASAGQRFTINRVQHEMGLSHSTIYMIVQGPKGFLWFGTQNGLNKYDGHKTTIYQHRPGDDNSLLSNSISSMVFDAQGVLWLGTWGGGLNRFDPASETFTHFVNDTRDPRSLSSNLVQTVFRDRRNRIWVGTNQGGLNLFDPATGTFTRYQHDPDDPESLSHNRVWSVTEDWRGRIWVATSEGLNRLEESGRFTHFFHDPDNPLSLSHNKIRQVICNRHGLLWVGTEAGLNLFDPDSESTQEYQSDADPKHYLKTQVITILYEDREGSLWVGTIFHGLSRFVADEKHPSLGRFERFTHDPIDLNSLSQNDIRAVIQDRSGVFWVGTRTGGLNKMVPTKFDHHRLFSYSPTDLIHNRVNALVMDRFDRLWVGSVGGLIRWDFQGDAHRFYNHRPGDPETLCDDRIYALGVDSRDRIWIGTFAGGISVLEPELGKMVLQLPAPDPLPNGSLRAIFEDSRQNMWLGTHGGLVRYRLADGDTTVFATLANDAGSLSDNHINAILEDGAGRIWIGTENGGLNRFDPTTERFARFRHDSNRPHSLSQNHVRPMLLGRDDVLWIGTYGGGLNRLDRLDADPESAMFTRYTVEDGLPDDTIYAMIEMGDYLWISTEQSLCRFHPATETFRTYDRYDGLQEHGFNAGAVTHGADSRIFFGGNNGFNSFLPGQVRDNLRKPQIAITGFKVFDSEVPFDARDNATNPIRIRHDDSVISFHFAVLDFNAPEKNRYAYKLEGFDRDFVDGGARSEVTYTNLDPGDYRFMVKGANNDGVWSETTTSLAVTIVSPPWQRWWAYCLYALGAVSLFWMYKRNQDRKLALERMVVESLQRNNRLKDEFLANTSHELRTPLNGIIGIVESMIDGATGTLPTNMKQNLQMVAASGRRLANLVNDILDFSKLKTRDLALQCKPLDLSATVEMVLTVSHALVGSKPLVLQNEVPEDLPRVRGDEDRLLQILYNLVGNAIKFTPKGSVTVRAVEEEGWIRVTVSDTGIGIAADKHEAIFESFEQVDGSTARSYGGSGLGLAITKRLVELHEGHIWVESEPEEGATFSFTLPVADAEDRYPTATELAAENDFGSQPGAAMAIGIPAPHEWTFEKQGQSLAKAAAEFKLLLVDDDAVNLQVLVNHLSLQGYTLHLASSGQEALDILESEGPFDLVLLDVMMPKMSGYDVCRRMRRRHGPSALPILLLTAKNQVTDLVEGFAAGASDYLFKPVARDELLARLSTHLQLVIKTRELRSSNAKLEEYNQMLEQKVDERTRDVRASHRELQILEKIVQEINREVSLESLLAKLLEQAIGLFTKATGGLFFLAEPGPPSRVHHYFRIAARVGHEHLDLPPLVPDTWFFERFENFMEEVQGGVYRISPREGKPDPLSRIVMDIRIEGSLEGFLVLDNQDEVHAFDDDDFQKLHRLREHAVSAVSKVRFLEELKAKNAEILRAQEKLVDAAHHAGMAEIATNLLHNIGNAMASVKTSIEVLLESLDQNQALRFYRRILDMLREFQEPADLAQFFERDPRGEMVVSSFGRIESEWGRYMSGLREETNRLQHHLIAIDNIVESQREIAASESLVEEADLHQLLDSVLHFQRLNLEKAEIELVREYGDLPRVAVQKAKFNRVLVHLISNAIDALREVPRPRRLILRTTTTKQGAVQLSVIDQGAGIPEENVSRIFTQGFTTKEGGQGYGLHYCANAINEMKGSIRVESQGAGKGTKFTVDLPTAA